MIKSLKPGESEQCPETWVKALNQAIREALKNSKIDPADVVCVGSGSAAWVGTAGQSTQAHQTG